MTEEDEEPRQKQRPFTRRSINAQPLQLKNGAKDVLLACAIDEIKENCSRKTYSTINTLLENYNKIQKVAVENK